VSAESWAEVLISLFALGIMTLAASVDALSALISRNRLRQSAEEDERHRRSLQALLDPRRSLSSAMLTIQMASVALIGSLLTATIRREVSSADHLFAVGITAVAFVVLGQALPRAVARNRPEQTAALLLSVGGALSTLSRPLAWLIEAISRIFDRMLPGGPDEVPAETVDDDARTVTIAEGDDGVIEAGEQEMIDGVLHLERVSVRDIMVPRVDITAVPRSVAPRELIDTIISAGHSRIPVYGDSIDQIVGILYAKDLLPFVISNNEVLPLVSLLRRPYVVPESKRIDDLLRELRQTKIHIAVVADEYGGTAGLVTIEDILEEIVGEIQDEYDTETPLFELSGPDELIADGRLALEDVEDALRVKFEKDDYGTLGGFVQRHLGRVPEEADVFEAEGVRVEILEVERHRVRKLRVSKYPPGQESAADRADSDDRVGQGQTDTGHK
jgi:putative hemolysin